MKHTKNILKSLLITVMALSLAVSCSKDEGGTKNPVNPAPITIKASDLTQVLNGIVIPSNISFASVIPASGKASVTAETDTYDTLKTALDGVLATGQEQVTVEASYGAKNGKTFDLTLTITAKAGYVLDDKMTEYTYNTSNKTAQLIITITAANSSNWK